MRDEDVAPDSLKAWLQLQSGLKPLFDSNSTDEEFDRALEKHIEESVRWLEDNANALHKNSEDSLSATLAAQMSIKDLITVSREENNRGHVDITIRVFSSSRKRLGEAKIYRGYSGYDKGIGQLVKRYATGRERTGYMFCYVKDADIKQRIEALMAGCDDGRPCDQLEPSTLHLTKWAFETVHRHSSGEKLRVVHFGVNLYVE